MTVLQDSVVLDGVKFTTDGYLVADAFTVRTGIQLYRGHEVDKPELDVVRVYRPEEEVFSQDSLRSFSHVPVTVDHPSVLVTADNWKEFAVGETSSGATRDGDRLRLPLVIKDKAAIVSVNRGMRQLSAGYVCQVDFTPGTTPDGQPYDAVQRDIRANHIAIVSQGRAGPEFKIGDEAVKTMKVDGFTIPVTDLAEEAITKLLGEKASLTADNLTLSTAKAALEDEIASLKAPKPMTDATVMDGFRRELMAASRSTGNRTDLFSVSDSQAAYEASLANGWKEPL